MAAGAVHDATVRYIDGEPLNLVFLTRSSAEQHKSMSVPPIRLARHDRRIPMRRTLIAVLAASVMVPSLASAQTGELNRGREEVRRGEAEVQRDLRRGDVREAREDRREVREDRREYNEDWREYRRKHQSVYRRGNYQAPRGYRYTPVRVGFQLRPVYYGNRYWISDPQTYRLPRANVGARYIRYGNDVLLINTRTGRVLRVYNGFFW
jgi:Ni/Co efflux regulator RcnB